MAQLTCVPQDHRSCGIEYACESDLGLYDDQKGAGPGLA